MTRSSSIGNRNRAREEPPLSLYFGAPKKESTQSNLTVSADAESTKATASASIAIAGRVLGKELHRLKLKWLDLQGADLRLGEKAYATGKVDGQSELSTKLDGVRQRITQLRERQGQTPSTFGGKVKAFATKVRKTI